MLIAHLWHLSPIGPLNRVWVDFFFIYVSVCEHTHLYVHMHTMGHIWTSEDNSWKLVKFFFHESSRDWTQIPSLGSKHLQLLSHPTSSDRLSSPPIIPHVTGLCGVALFSKCQVFQLLFLALTDGAGLTKPLLCSGWGYSLVKPPVVSEM